jgi:hypothetical protein
MCASYFISVLGVPCIHFAAMVRITGVVLEVALLQADSKVIRFYLAHE